MDDDSVANFVAITGASEQVARQLLEISGGNIEQAAVLFYDTDMAETLARQPAAAAPAASSSAAQASRSTGTSRTASRAASRSRRRGQSSRGREDADGVITIDDSDDDNNNRNDDDDDDMDFDELEDIDDDDDDDDVIDVDASMSDAAAAASVARTAQEEEDAAMAKRLQEELYGGGGGGGGGGGSGSGGGGGGLDDDDIRAPMGRTTEMLVEPSYVGGSGGYGSYGGESIYDMMRAQRMRQAARGPRNPFNQVWDNDIDGIGEEGSGQTSGVTGGESPSLGPTISAPSTRQARLADLFRPPYDLIEHVSSWDEARSIGKDEKRWILTNIQDMSDFQCQALNRDIWKDNAIKQLVRENFVFLQYNKDDILAESYIQYYMPGGQHENPDNYPHIGVVDPRTGEQVKVWSGRPFPTALEFHAQLAEFLDRYSLDATKKNPVQRTKPQVVVKDVGRMTEDEMLEMALANSLATAGGPSNEAGEASGSGSRSVSGASNGNGVQDPDELTGTPAPEAEPEAEEAEEASAFAAISSTTPHEEPPTSTPPASATRIQFRHPTGRVIRRFATDDRVVRIYEWLKAAPLEGHDGEAFELKVMPQGHDLLEDLDKTIEEAGLKQATVMIEFLE